MRRRRPSEGTAALAGRGAVRQGVCSASWWRALRTGSIRRSATTYARLFSQAIACAREGVDPAAAGVALRSHSLDPARRGKAAPHLRALACHAGRRCGGHQRHARRGASAASRTPSWCLSDRGKTTSCSRANRTCTSLPWNTAGAACSSACVWDDLEPLLSAADSRGDRSRFAAHPAGLLPVCPEEPLPSLRKPFLRQRFGPHLAGAGVGMGGRDFRRHRREAVRALCRAAETTARPYRRESRGGRESRPSGCPTLSNRNCSRLLAATGLPLCVDQGAGGEEPERVQRAVERSGVRAAFWNGSFAGLRRRSLPAPRCTWATIPRDSTWPRPAACR